MSHIFIRILKEAWEIDLSAFMPIFISNSHVYLFKNKGHHNVKKHMYPDIEIQNDSEVGNTNEAIFGLN